MPTLAENLLFGQQPTKPPTETPVSSSYPTPQPIQPNAPKQVNIKPPTPFLAKSVTSAGEPYYGTGIEGYVRRLFGPVLGRNVLQSPTAQQQLEIRKAVTNASDDQKGELWDSTIGKFTNIYYSELVAGRASQEIKERETAEKEDRSLFSVQAESLVDTLKGNALRTMGYGVLLPLFSAGEYAVRTGVVAPFLAAKDSQGDFSERYSAYVDGSNAIYTLALDKTKRMDFARRALAGEDPGLLVAEMENGFYNPWIELAGGLFLDPTMWIGVGAVKSAVRGVKEADTLADALRAGSKAFRYVGPFAKRGASKAAIEATEKSVNELLSMTDEAQKIIGSTTDAAVKSNAANKVAEVFDVLPKYAKDNLNKYHSYGSTDFALKTLQQGGKRTVAMDGFASVMNVVAGKYQGKMDEIPELIKAIVNLTSDNAKDAENAVSTLMRSPAKNEIFSKNGDSFRALITEMTNTAWIKDVDGKTVNLLENMQMFRGKEDELIEILSKNMDSAVNKIFPNFDDMAVAANKVKQYDELVKLGKDVKKLPDTVHELAAMYEKIDPLSRRVLTWDAKAQNTIFRKANKVFANIYMGYTPGYVVRNFLNNTFTIWQDQGLSTALYATKAGFWGGLETFWKKGTHTALLEQNVLKYIGYLPESLRRGTQGIVSTLDVGEKVGPTLKFSMGGERGYRLAMLEKSIVNDLLPFVNDGMYKYGLNFDELGDFGARIDDIMKMTLGDTKAVREFIEDSFKTQSIKKWMTNTAPAPVQKYFAQTGILPYWNDLLGRASDFKDNPRGFVEEFTKIWDSIAEGAVREARNEPAFMSEAVQQLLIPIEEMAEKGIISDAQKEFFNNMALYSDKAYGIATLEAAKEGVVDALDFGRKYELTQ